MSIQDSEDEGEEWSGEEESEDEENDEERLFAMGEEAKEEVRNKLREMKAVYRSILQRNLELPDQFQIPESELKLPREIYAHIEDKIFEDCDEVFRIHEYESAETIIQLDKIRKFYFSPIQTHHIVVKDITHEIQVMSIRNKKVTEEFKELFETTAAAVEEETRLLREKGLRTDTKGDVELPPIKRIYAKDIIGEYESKLDAYDIETVHNIRHLERRLEQRYHREIAWQQLMSQKIGPDYVAPEDEEELQKAKDGTGVFRLQNSDNFLGEQISMAERRQRIINMKMTMRERIQEFNKLVLEARDEKPKVLNECKRIEKEIKKIHVLLPEEYKRKIPKMYEMEPEETPETVLDITLEEVQKEEAKMIEEGELAGIRDEILEKYFGVKKPEKPPYLMDEDANRTLVVPPPAATAARQAKNIDLENETVASHRCRKAQFNPQTEMERRRFESLFYPRIYRQEALFKELFGVLNYFHERIKYLYDRRVQLEIETKVQTVGLLTAVCELDVAKEFQAQEDGIIERLLAQQAESRNVKGHMDKIKKKMNNESSDIRKLENEINNLAIDGAAIIKGRFSKYLWKVYRRKKKKPIPEFLDEDGEVIEGIEVDYSQLVDDLSEESGDEKEKYDLEVCPETLDRHIYNRVCDLREKKYKLEDLIAEHAETLNQFTADYEEVEAVFLKYEARIAEISEEIRVLQRRRQKRMNDLKLMVILRADQIQCMDMEELMDLEGNVMEKLAQTYPGTSNMVIFPKNGSEELQRRQVELVKKAKAEKQRCKLGKKMLVRLKEELKKGELKVQQIKEKAKDDMVMKFGQEVDLDQITAAIINLELLDQEIILDQMKKEQYKERRLVGKEVDRVRYDLTKRVKDNSKYNMLQAMMMERRRDIEYYIWKNEKGTALELKDLLESDVEAAELTKHLEHVISTSKTVNSSSKDSSSKEGSNSNSKESKGLEEEIQKVRSVLKRQNSRINELKEVLHKCRGKTGLPPLIPLCQRISPDELRRSQTGRKAPEHGKFMQPAKEMPELNQYCQPTAIQCGVQTIFKDEKLKLDKSTSWTSKSLVNVDKKAEAETSRLFGSSGVEVDLSVLTSGPDYLDDDMFEKKEALDELGKTIKEFLPDEEEQEEFLQYMDSVEVLEDVDEILNREKEAHRGSLPPIHEHDHHGHVGFQVEQQEEEDEEEEEEEQKAGPTPLPSRKSKRKATRTKSYIVKDPKTESEVLAKVRRYSIMPVTDPRLEDDLEALEAGKEIAKDRKSKLDDLAKAAGKDEDA